MDIRKIVSIFKWTLFLIGFNMSSVQLYLISYSAVRLA